MKQVKSKVAIVTGAASGIGKKTALLLAEEGAKVVVSDIAEEGGKKVVKEIEDNGGEALFVKADTSKPKQTTKNWFKKRWVKRGSNLSKNCIP